jgi:hypothetical protein
MSHVAVKEHRRSQAVNAMSLPELIRNEKEVLYPGGALEELRVAALQAAVQIGQ